MDPIMDFMFNGSSSGGGRNATNGDDVSVNLMLIQFLIVVVGFATYMFVSPEEFWTILTRVGSAIVGLLLSSIVSCSKMEAETYPSTLVAVRYCLTIYAFCWAPIIIANVFSFFGLLY